MVLVRAAPRIVMMQYRPPAFVAFIMHMSYLTLCRLYKVWMARQYPAYYPNTLLLDNALATMGAGVPSGMAAKLVHPEVRGLLYPVML